MTGTLSELVRALLHEGTPARFGRFTLDEDPLVRRLKGREQEALAVALQAGETAAREVAVSYGRDPERALEALGVKLVREESDGQFGHVIPLSVYQSKPPTITLQMSTIELVRQLILENRLADNLGLSDISPIQIAHELYHHLEAQKLTEGTSGFRRDIIRLGPIRWGTGFPSLSEVAADRFAVALLETKAHPKIIQAMLIHKHNADYAWQVRDQIRDYPYSV